jgi:predicted Co/Zn/Cd cation transporter (cation efflux family)
LSVGGAELDFKLDVSVTLQADMEPNSVTFTLNAAMLQPIVALLAGILILLIPRILNFIVAIYLIFVGVTGLWPHFLSALPH